MLLAKGITFQVDTGSGANPIQGVTTFTLSGTQWSTEDTTSMDNSVPVKTLQTTVRSDGDISLVILWDSDDAVHQSLRTLSTSGDTADFTITYPGSSIGTFTFTGFVSSFAYDTPVAGLQKAKVKITAMGAIADQAASLVSVAVTDSHAGVYVTGDHITLTATFDESVVVTGTPYIAITLTSGTVHVAYTLGSNTNMLTFDYTVGSGDAAAATHFSIGSPINLNSGTIKDMGGQAATLTFTAPTTSAFTVN